MRSPAWLLLILGAAVLTGCRGQQPPPKTAPKTVESVKITQFYTSTPQIARGEKGLVCYGVENAKTVWLSPPRQELSAALSRCVDVTPEATTTYTLTAEGETGQRATQDLTVAVGAARAKIIEVKVSALEVARGAQVSICYKVANAASVRIEPIHFRGGARSEGCTMASPQETTTYVLTVAGAGGEQDQERVTVKVR
jgi:hypothetical protein